MKRRATANLAIDPKKLKEARGVQKQADVAKAVGVTPQQISRIENGWVRPSSDLLLRLCTVYKVEIQSLVSN